ncbi:hypothetical protein ALI22I_20450 [Saccharothrix sp. ALI-22-I]|nr:hypothetical protein ALI22I_20450 [Saccharothrix sp. ALI-22-I]
MHRIVSAARFLHTEVQQNGAWLAARAMSMLDAPVLAAVLAAVNDGCTALAEVTGQAEKTIQLPAPSDDFDDPTDGTCSFADAASDLDHVEGGFLVALALLDPHGLRDNVTFRDPGTFVVDFRNQLDGTVQRHEVPDMERAYDLIDGPPPFDHATMTIQFAVRRDGKVLLTPVEFARAARQQG